MARDGQRRRLPHCEPKPIAPCGEFVPPLDELTPIQDEFCFCFPARQVPTEIETQHESREHDGVGDGQCRPAQPLGNPRQPVVCDDAHDEDDSESERRLSCGLNTHHFEPDHHLVDARPVLVPAAFVDNALHRAVQSTCTGMRVCDDTCRQAERNHPQDAVHGSDLEDDVCYRTIDERDCNCGGQGLYEAEADYEKSVFRGELPTQELVVIDVFVPKGNPECEDRHEDDPVRVQTEQCHREGNGEDGEDNALDHGQERHVDATEVRKRGIVNQRAIGNGAPGGRCRFTVSGRGGSLWHAVCPPYAQIALVVAPKLSMVVPCSRVRDRAEVGVQAAEYAFFSYDDMWPAGVSDETRSRLRAKSMLLN